MDGSRRWQKMPESAIQKLLQLHGLMFEKNRNPTPKNIRGRVSDNGILSDGVSYEQYSHANKKG